MKGFLDRGGDSWGAVVYQRSRKAGLRPGNRTEPLQFGQRHHFFTAFQSTVRIAWDVVHRVRLEAVISHISIERLHYLRYFYDVVCTSSLYCSPP